MLLLLGVFSLIKQQSGLRITYGLEALDGAGLGRNTLWHSVANGKLYEVKTLRCCECELFGKEYKFIS